jgi:oligopeptide transport system substrate-binding protein
MRFFNCMAFCFFSLLVACTPTSKTSDNTFYGYTREYVSSLDPIHASDYFSSQMAAQVYEGLYHYKYQSNPLELEPLLAEGMPEISKEGTLYKIRLKKNIYFHPHAAFQQPEKRLFVAEDFIYSLRRLADARNSSSSFWIVENKIVGLDEWRKKLSTGSANFSTPISGLRALDPHTLEIQLTAPNYQFLQTLAMAATFVVPWEVVEKSGAEFGSLAVGTGAFKLDSWIRGSQLRFSKNQNYRTLSQNNKPLPHIDSVVIYEITESQPQRLLFWKGDLDILQPLKSHQDLLMKKGRLLPELEAKGYQLDLSPSPDVTFIVFNNENPYLKNKLVRKALSMVFDRSFTIQHFYNFNAVAAHGPIPPLLEGYTKSHSALSPAYDVERAKTVLKEAGFPNGNGIPELNFEMSSSNVTARELAEYTKNQFALLNIRLKLNINTWPQLNDKIKKKTADIFDFAWNADYPDAQNFLQLFYSKNISPGPNFANYKNLAYDVLYEKALKLPPGSERALLYSEMEKILIEDCPWIFQTHRVRGVVAQPWLNNYNFNIMVLDTFKYLSIDSAQRAHFQKQGQHLGEN